MPKIESEKIDCLHRPCSRPAPRGKIKSVRTHAEVIEQFDSFSLLKLLFLVRNWHCWSRKAFTRQMTPQIREEIAKTAVFRHRWQAWKVVRSIAAVRQRPRTPRNWRCSLAFSSLSFDISIKNSMQRRSSDFQGLFCVKIRKMAQGSNDLSTLPLMADTKRPRWYVPNHLSEPTGNACVLNKNRAPQDNLCLTNMHVVTTAWHGWFCYQRWTA